MEFVPFMMSKLDFLYLSLGHFWGVYDGREGAEIFSYIAQYNVNRPINNSVLIC